MTFRFSLSLFRFLYQLFYRSYPGGRTFPNFSSLFNSFGLENGENDMILIQNGVLLTDLNGKGAKSLIDDVNERGVKAEETTDYDGLLDAVLDSSVVITI